MQEEPEKPTDFINDPESILTLSADTEIKWDYRPHYPLKIACLHPDAVIPRQGSNESAGYDLYTVEDLRIHPGQIKLVPLGFATEMPKEIHGRIEARSGLASEGLVVLTGVIDPDYRGEWKVILRNYGHEQRLITKGSKIAQVVFRPTILASFTVGDLAESERGTGGFGSTGQ